MIAENNKCKTGSRSIKKFIFNIVLSALLLLLFNFTVFAESRLDNLDKDPMGAHKGQMLIGGYLTIGMPIGNIISAENDFLDNNTYTFSESSVTKELWITHLTFSFGAFFEYMFIDNFGAKVKFKKDQCIQKTVFGPDFENWTGTLFSGYSFLIGPTFHVTTRKKWDIMINPLIGYHISKYSTTPIAEKLVSSYSGEEKWVKGLSVGSELNFVLYFSGGLFLSLGFNWYMNMFTLDSPFNLTQGGATYFENETSGQNHTLSAIISMGYAFSN